MDEEMEARLVLRLDRMEEKMDRALEKLNNLEKRMDMMERDNNNEVQLFLLPQNRLILDERRGGGGDPDGAEYWK